MSRFVEILVRRIEADPDLSEAGLAVKAGLNNSTIRQMIAKGANPREDTMRKVAAAFGESLETFMAEGRDPRTTRLLHLLEELTPEEQALLTTFATSILAQRQAADEPRPEAAK